MKIYFEPYGCTLNYGESRKMEELVADAGHQSVQNMNHADVLVLVTCTVIETTENKMLRQLAKFSRTNKPVIVAGCMAAVQAETVLQAHPTARLLPPAKISDITQLIDSISEQYKFKTQESARSSGSKPRTAIDAIIPISNGCPGRCTYCITKLARGELRSYAPRNILSEISKAIARDLLEVRLTAQDTAVYGRDRNTNLPALLKLINDKFSTENGFRIRVGMMNPNTTGPILEDLIEEYQSEKVFKFLHLPVQSGDNDILKDMKRGYEVKDFLHIVERFRKKFTKLTLSTDIIIGYPGETVQQFRNSIELIREVKPNIVNITRFSARPGTEAYDRKDKLHGSIQKERSRALTKLRFEISKELNEESIGETKRILTTEIGKGNSVMGRADNYQVVVVKEKLELGNFVDVKIVNATDSYLIGKII